MFKSNVEIKDQDAWLGIELGSGPCRLQWLTIAVGLCVHVCACSLTCSLQ